MIALKSGIFRKHIDFSSNSQLFKPTRPAQTRLQRKLDPTIQGVRRPFILRIFFGFQLNFVSNSLNLGFYTSSILLTSEVSVTWQNSFLLYAHVHHSTAPGFLFLSPLSAWLLRPPVAAHDGSGRFWQAGKGTRLPNGVVRLLGFE